MDLSTFYLIALEHTNHVGAVLAKTLVSYCRSPEAVFKEKKGNLIKIPGIGFQAANSILGKKGLAEAEKEQLFVEKNKIQVLSYLQPLYPKRLLHCYDGPTILYKKGSSDLNAQRMLSIVGTRRITSYGKKIIDDLIKGLVKSKPAVISGMAYGVDAAVHQACLKYGLNTIGVLGHGLHKLYPDIHRNMAKEMIYNEGALITEFSSQNKMVPGNFPKRNRIIAGISDATVVIESSIKGGAMITANIANSYNKDVFTVPGRVGDPYSKGCNFLLKTHKAQVLENVDDLVQAMSWDDEENSTKKKNIKKELFVDYTKHQQKIIEAFKEFDTVTTDKLSMLTQLSSGELASSLLELEINGVVEGISGSRYRLF